MDAFDSGWIAPLGRTSMPSSASWRRRSGQPPPPFRAAPRRSIWRCCSSGSARRRGLVPTLTFLASASAAQYIGARHDVVDCDLTRWHDRPRPGGGGLAIGHAGRLPAAVVDRRPVRAARRLRTALELCEELRGAAGRGRRRGAGYHVPRRPAGSFGVAGVFSFNGNKIITTSGGGMLVSRAPRPHRARPSLATQARDPSPTTSTSNSATTTAEQPAGGARRGQLAGLDRRIARRRTSTSLQGTLRGMAGITFMPLVDYGYAQLLVHLHPCRPERFGAEPEDSPGARGEDIERAPLEAAAPAAAVRRQRRRSAARRAGVFERGLCLPSGSSLSDTPSGPLVEVIHRLSSPA